MSSRLALLVVALAVCGVAVAEHSLRNCPETVTSLLHAFAEQETQWMHEEQILTAMATLLSHNVSTEFLSSLVSVEMNPPKIAEDVDEHDTTRVAARVLLALSGGGGGGGGGEEEEHKVVPPAANSTTTSSAASGERKNKEEEHHGEDEHSAPHHQDDEEAHEHNHHHNTEITVPSSHVLQMMDALAASIAEEKEALAERIHKAYSACSARCKSGETLLISQMDEQHHDQKTWKRKAKALSLRLSKLIGKKQGGAVMRDATGIFSKKRRAALKEKIHQVAEEYKHARHAYRSARRRAEALRSDLHHTYSRCASLPDEKDLPDLEEHPHLLHSHHHAEEEQHEEHHDHDEKKGEAVPDIARIRCVLRCEKRASDLTQFHIREAHEEQHACLEKEKNSHDKEESCHLSHFLQAIPLIDCEKSCERKMKLHHLTKAQREEMDRQAAKVNEAHESVTVHLEPHKAITHPQEEEEDDEE